MSSTGKLITISLVGLLVLVLLVFLVFIPTKNTETKATDSKTETSAPASGTVSGSMYSEVIDNAHGFIIENVSFADQNNQKAITLFGAAKVVDGTSSLMVIKGQGKDASVKTLLFLQFSKFAEGSAVEFNGDPKSAQFYVAGTADGKQSIQESGLISGSVRFVKTQPGTTSIPGYTGELREGTGDMEVIVSNINASGLAIDKEKKYTARYALPIVPFSKWAALNVPM